VVAAADFVRIHFGDKVSLARSTTPPHPNVSRSYGEGTEPGRSARLPEAGSAGAATRTGEFGGKPFREDSVREVRGGRADQPEAEGFRMPA
jgi:hypothetical protein